MYLSQVCACVLSQLCPTLCGPMGCGQPGSSVHGILQTRLLDWATMPSSRDLPDPRIKTTPILLPVLAGRLFTTSTTWESTILYGVHKYL